MTTTTQAMTPDDLAAAGRRLCGDQHGWLTEFASLLPMRPDALRHMLAGRRPISEWVPERVAALLAQRGRAVDVAVSIAPPPASMRPEADRDGPCGEALDPVLDAVAQAAERAGWLPAEVVAAVMGWTIHAAAEGAGEAAARQLLEEAGELLALR